MKRKITFVLMAMTSVLMSLAHADGFEMLVFKTIKGDSYSVVTQGLEIYFKEGYLTFSNNELNIPVTSLMSMEFSDNSGVETTISDSPGSVAVFSIDGIRKREYSSLQEAYKDLRVGLYVVRQSDGKTFKIRVGQ